MNLSRFLPGLAKRDNAKPTEEELDQLDAEAKAERIRFHREHVRNGPRTPSHVTQGRAESYLRRGQKIATLRANKRDRADWIRANRQLSTLRGQLEVVAKTDLAGTPIYENAMRGLFATYGPTVQQGLDDTAGSNQAAGEAFDEVRVDFNDQQHRSVVVQAAAHHYKLATGQVAA